MRKNKNKDMEIITPKKPKTKRSFSITIISLILAIAMFAALVYSEKRILSSYDKSNVVVAKTDIDKYQNITEKNKKQYFEVKQFYLQELPEKYYKSLKEVPTGLADKKMYANEIITDLSVKSSESFVTGIEDPVMTSLNCASISDAVGGILRRGDKVTVSLIDRSGTTVLSLKDVYIYEAMTADGKKITSKNSGEAIAVLYNIILSSKDEQLLASKLAQADSIVRLCKTSDVQY